MYTFLFKTLFNTLCLRFPFIVLWTNIQHNLFYMQRLITRWSTGCLNCTYYAFSKAQSFSSFDRKHSVFNLEETQLLKRYKCVYGGMIKRFKQFWVASKLPIGQTVFGRKLYFVLGFKCAEGSDWRHPVSWGEEASRFFSSVLVSSSRTQDRWYVCVCACMRMCVWWFTIA